MLFWYLNISSIDDSKLHVSVTVDLGTSHQEVFLRLDLLQLYLKSLKNKVPVQGVLGSQLLGGLNADSAVDPFESIKQVSGILGSQELCSLETFVLHP